MKKIIYLLLAFTLLLQSACSEDTVGSELTGTLTGTVRAESSGEPLENVEISTSPASSTVFTDSLGEFTIENIIADEYSVKAELGSYITAFEGVTVTADGVSNVAFELLFSNANNRQPSTPEAVYPEDNTAISVLNVDFAWDAEDPEGDELTYELEIRNDLDEEILTFSEITDTTFTVSDLSYGRKYFWQVKVSDSINEPVLSPVYTFRTADFPTDSYFFVREINDKNVIFAADANGEEARLTDMQSNSFRPRKNNSINRIAFLRTTGANTHLFTMKPDGSDVKQVTSSIPVNSINSERVGFAWSNDGSYLLYPHLDKLYKVKSTGEGKEIIYDAPEGRFVINATVSRDDSVIIIHTTDVNGYNAAIFTINQEGQRQKTIIDNVMGSLGGLDISVDNKLVLYTHDVSGYESAGDRDLNMKMFLFNLETNQVYDLSSGKPNGTNDKDPRFSPNEASVIFTNSSNTETSQNNIYTVAFDEVFETDDERRLLIENAKMPDWE